MPETGLNLDVNFLLSALPGGSSPVALLGGDGPLRVGVYVDGFNLFYGGRALCGAEQSWKWLDIRGLATALIAGRGDWAGAVIYRVVYCTGEVTGSLESLARQQQYVLALRAHGSVDHVAYGKFQISAKESLVATSRRRGVNLLEFDADPLPDAPWTRMAADGRHLLVKHRKQEEKGSDVNVASHLLIDVLEGTVGARALDLSSAGPGSQCYL